MQSTVESSCGQEGLFFAENALLRRKGNILPPPRRREKPAGPGRPPPVCPLDAQMQEVDEWSAPGRGGSPFPLLSPYSAGKKRERTRPGATLRGCLGRQGLSRATAQTPDARFSSPPCAWDSSGRPLLRCLLRLGPGDSGMERAQGLRLGSQDHFAPHLSLGALPLGTFTHRTPRDSSTDWDPGLTFGPAEAAGLRLPSGPRGSLACCVDVPGCPQTPIPRVPLQLPGSLGPRNCRLHPEGSRCVLRPEDRQGAKTCN